MTQAASLMDRMYRHQRHVYDATRKFYLLGRDQLLSELQPPEHGRVLEIGCGTARNLIRLAQKHSTMRGFGLDVSSQMLTTAAAAVRRTKLDERIVLAQGDAATFDAPQIFGCDTFERIYFSYTLSMIPAWQTAVRNACRFVAPSGSLHIVDFGNQTGLPMLARRALNGWLQLFDVSPRCDFDEEIQTLTKDRQLQTRTISRLRGYVVHAVAVAPPRLRPEPRNIGSLA